MRGASSRMLCLAVLAASVAGISSCAAIDARVEPSNAALDTRLDGDAPGCAGAVAHHGDVVWSHARGLANVESQTRMDSRTRFNLGDVSMQFTGLAALVLAEQGALDLDAPVSTYLEGLPEWDDEVTVRNLMNHSSGILDPAHPSGDVITRDVLFDDLLSDAGTFSRPGSFGYATTNYVLLAAVIESVTGEEFPDWMAQNVFGPAGREMAVELNSTSVGAAVGYGSAEEPFSPVVDNWFVVGPTAVITSAGELARWGDHYREPRLVGRDTLDDAVAEGSELRDGGTYAAGIVHSEQWWSHSGYDKGVSTTFATNSEAGTTLVLICNAPIADLDDMWSDLMEIWLPEP